MTNGSTRPNIIFVMTDDMRAPTEAGHDDLEAMPDVVDLIGNGQSPPQGQKLARCYAATPLCCPNRASLLTGQYSHNHGVVYNQNADGGGHDALRQIDHDTLPVWLKAAGYKTGMAGKYINGYDDAGSYVPPGWDDWRALQAGTYTYFGDFQANQNGSVSQVNDGFTTKWIKDRMLARIDQWAPGSQPFFLWASFAAPHNAHPAAEPQYEGTSNVGAPESSAFNRDDMTGMPPWFQDEAKQDVQEMVSQRRDRRESLKSVNDAVKAMRDKLVQHGEMDNTLWIFVSDNGYMLGEHRLVAKSKPYEESSKLACSVRWTDGPIDPGVAFRMTSFLDLTATIVDVADATPGHPLDGTSLLTPLPPDGQYRPVLVEGDDHPGGAPPWRMVRVAGPDSAQWAYIEWGPLDDPSFVELHDLKAHPWQQHNKAGEPAYVDVQQSLATLLGQMKNGAGTDYNITWSAP